MNKHKNLIQIIKFTLFSLSAGLIQIVSSEILHDVLHMVYWLAYLIGLVLSVVWNFTFNRKFTFKSANNVPFAMFLVFLYYLVFTPISTIGGKYLESLGVIGILVTVINMIINFVTEFLYQKFVVFKNSIDTNNLAKSEDEQQFNIIMKILKNK